MSLYSNNILHKSLILELTLVYFTASHITSESTCAAAMHWSADSLLLNWAKAQPGKNSMKWTWVRKQCVQLCCDRLTFWMFCFWMDNNLYIVKFSKLQKNLLKFLLLCVKRKVPWKEMSKIKWIHVLIFFFNIETCLRLLHYNYNEQLCSCFYR